MFRVIRSMDLAFPRPAGRLPRDREFFKELRFVREALTLERLPGIRLAPRQAQARLTLLPLRVLAILRASMRRQRGLSAFKTIMLDRVTPGMLRALVTRSHLSKL